MKRIIFDKQGKISSVTSFNTYSQRLYSTCFQLFLSDGNAKLIYLMHSSEQPQLTFSILENNTCVVSDNGFHLMISKLKLFYTPRKGGKIDVSNLLSIMRRRTIYSKLRVALWFCSYHKVRGSVHSADKFSKYVHHSFGPTHAM